MHSAHERDLEPRVLRNNSNAEVTHPRAQPHVGAITIELSLWRDASYSKRRSVRVVRDGCIHTRLSLVYFSRLAFYAHIRHADLVGNEEDLVRR